MKHDPQRIVESVLRNDFLSFAAKCFGHVTPRQELHRTWHLLAMAYQLERCRRGEVKRLIITLPPRHMKSIMASVALPAFILGHDPTARIICASYSAELGAKHARDSRAVMTSDWYKKLFPGTRLSLERNAEADFMTTERGYRSAVSVGGSLTGRGGNFIIIDDPMKAEDALSAVKRLSAVNWFDNTIYTRLDNKRTDVMIIIMQRLHIDDLVGHVLSKNEGWVHLDLPAIAEVDELVPIGPGQFCQRRAGDLLSPDREPRPILDELCRQMGAYNFSAQYQQRPIPVEGELIKWSWFRSYDVPPRQPCLIYQSWDTAQKDGELNDYSVCTTWAFDNGNYYLLDLYRARLLYPDLRRQVIEQRRRWNARTVLIEDKGSGTALLQDFRYTLGCSVIPIEPEGDKTMRITTNSIPIEAGRVLLPSGASWLKELQKEVLQFPQGTYDDQLDSIAQFLGWFEKRQRGNRLICVKVGGI